jgi:uncharacterized protein YndB with AHSA1/START domain
MRARSVEHASFVVERSYPASPDRTFAAWADPEAKARWIGAAPEGYELDFRVGGWERHHGIAPDGRPYAFQAIYQDIVPPRRIVYTYDMLIEGTRISVSLATVEIAPEGSGSRLTYTEQGAFLDGRDRPADREHGMGSLLDVLGTYLQRG